MAFSWYSTNPFLESALSTLSALLEVGGLRWYVVSSTNMKARMNNAAAKAAST